VLPGVAGHRLHSTSANDSSRNLVTELLQSVAVS
jgi:hypothetical protein